MSSAFHLLQCARRHRALRFALLWMFVGLVVLKSSLPLLAALAAGVRDVAVAEVCSVYGMRSVSNQGPEQAPQAPDLHSAAGHCPLASALGIAWPALEDVAAVVLHAPPQGFLLLPAPRSQPVDRFMNWRASRTHAPPSSV